MKPIPFYSLEPMHREVGGEIQSAMAEVFAKNQFILGAHLEKFEKEYAAYNGAKYCVGLANGLDALFVSLHVLGIGKGDKVIVPAHTYIATWLAVSRTGATIVPVDVDDDAMLMDPEKVADVITTNTKAILPVHLYGCPCDMQKLMAVAAKYDLKVVEDCAQAHGAKVNGKMISTFGDCNAVSFYPTKNLGALGDGGAILTNDEAIYTTSKIFRNYGSSEKFVNDFQGINSRLDELQAAVLSVKLKKLKKWNDERRQLARTYLQSLKDVGDLQLPSRHDENGSVFHLFVVRTARREALREFLLRNGIETAVHYPTPPHLQRAYRNLNFKEGSFPITESLSKSVLSLPLWPGLSEGDQEYVIKSIKDFFLR